MNDAEMETRFTFLNTSNAPSLGDSETKRMRAHVTKVNFARRRRRIAKESHDGVLQERSGTQHDESGGITLSSRRQTSSELPSIDLGTELLISSIDTDFSVKYLLHEFRPLIFPTGNGGPRSFSEGVWIELLVSEPALLEASMAIGMRHSLGPSSLADRRNADLHTWRAVSIINRRLDTVSTQLTDGVLSAVFTLAFSEGLVNNDAARNIHINGLSQMIKLRRANGTDSIPPWFSDLLLFDCISSAISSPEDIHKGIIEALQDRSNHQLDDISNISLGITKLRGALECYHSSSTVTESITREIDELVSVLQFDVESILGSNGINGPYVRALAQAIGLYLHLSWPKCSTKNLNYLADNLRVALREPHIRLCSSIDLTVWQFLVGGVAAEMYSELWTWFLVRLRDMLLPMHVRGWKGMMGVLEKGFMPDSHLLKRFKVVWEEVMAM